MTKHDPVTSSDPTQNTQPPMVTGVDLTPVESSNIEAIGYKDGVLVVRFKSRATYWYQGVPPEVFPQLLQAESVGSMFHKLVKRAGYVYGQA